MKIRCLHSLIDVFVQMGVIVHLFSMPTIQCEQYTCDSATQEHYDCNEDECKTHKMHEIIQEICIEILTETNFEELMQSELDNI